MTPRIACFSIVAMLTNLSACGARTGLDVPDVMHTSDAPNVCVPVDDHCGAVEVCGNGLDDDCNGRVDEGCDCEPGAVQGCFAGPPGRRNVGVCRDGMQTCRGDRSWGECSGGVVPHQESTCNGADNLCTGCSHDTHCPIACPGPNDTRVPDGAPFAPYALRGGDFFAGTARSWQWQIEGGPCDAVSAQPSFSLTDATSENATFTPQLSGDYRVTLTAVTASGETLRCTFVVHVAGPGLRVEMCYPESTYADDDLYLHQSGNTDPWFDPGTADVYSASAVACSWHNCEAHLRSYFGTTTLPRADWGYAPTALANCEHGPFGREWRMLGDCANPRLDLDNNLQEGRGIPENINVDDPRDGDTFRIMVQNFTGTLTHPMINVYCAGRRVATYGAPPDALERFAGAPGWTNFGAMWRVADVSMTVDATGNTTGCHVQAIHPSGQTRGYAITQDDPSF